MTTAERVTLQKIMERQLRIASATDMTRLAMRESAMNTHNEIAALLAAADAASPASGVTEEPANSSDHQQRRGVAWDIIEEAINTFDEWMLDDDFDATSTLHKIIAKMRERAEAYAITGSPHIRGDRE